MGYNPEISRELYTPEQAEMLDIKLSRQPWVGRLHERIVGTLKRSVEYGLGGGAIGFVGGRVVGEVMLRVIDMLSPGSVDEGLASAIRVPLPVYLSFVVGSGLVAVMATTFAVSGKDLNDL